MKSFRFGPEIAYVASCVLDVLKGIRNKTLVGGAKRGEYRCTEFSFISFDVYSSRPVGCLHTCTVGWAKTTHRVGAGYGGDNDSVSPNIDSIKYIHSSLLFSSLPSLRVDTVPLNWYIVVLKVL